MTFVATEGSTQPIVLGKEPVPRPQFERDSDGNFLVDCASTVAIVNVRSENVATLIADVSGFRCTFHDAEYLGWYSGDYGRIISKKAVVTWEVSDGRA